MDNDSDDKEKKLNICPTQKKWSGHEKGFKCASSLYFGSPDFFQCSRTRPNEAREAISHIIYYVIDKWNISPSWSKHFLCLFRCYPCVCYSSGTPSVACNKIKINYYKYFSSLVMVTPRGSELSMETVRTWTVHSFYLPVAGFHGAGKSCVEELWCGVIRVTFVMLYLALDLEQTQECGWQKLCCVQNYWNSGALFFWLGCLAGNELYWTELYKQRNCTDCTDCTKRRKGFFWTVIAIRTEFSCGNWDVK